MNAGNKVSQGKAQKSDPATVEPITKSPFRSGGFAERLDELISLLSSDSRVFLFGAGSSRCAGLPLTTELTDAVLQLLGEGSEEGALLSLLRKPYGTETGCTIEDLLSELVDYLAIADRREVQSAAIKAISISESAFTRDQLSQTILTIKKAIATCITTPVKKLDIHRQFVQHIHDRLRSGKTSHTALVDYFILNYDTLIEDALALEHIRYSDGMTGGANGWWSIEQYAEPTVAARVFKVHGSIDWKLIPPETLPRRLRDDILLGSEPQRVLIWPATTKYRETQLDPFAQIIQIMRKSLRPSEKREVILAVIGYSFGDAHINLELDNALRESKGRLTLLAFTSQDSPQGILKRWSEDVDIGTNVIIYANKGFFHGTISEISTEPLLWWRFETLTELLGGVQ
jgi:hypothetical protein